METSDAPRERRREEDLDVKLKTLLQNFGRALSSAMADSSEVSQSLRHLQEEGYSLCLFVDCKRKGESDPRNKIMLSTRPEPQPAFKIDTRDLAFLRSIGIDPTRRMRRRRTPQTP